MELGKVMPAKKIRGSRSSWLHSRSRPARAEIQTQSKPGEQDNQRVKNFGMCIH